MAIFSKVFKNTVVRSMVATEFFSVGAAGVVFPVFAIFAADVIKDGSASVAGFSVAVFWTVKAIAQLPIARLLDKTDGERDDFYAYVLGQVLFSAGTLAYLLADSAFHVYLIQALLGFAAAINLPAFYGLFSRHVDKHYESFEWSMYSVVSYSVATAIAGAFAGIIVESLGFSVLFVISGTFFLVSAVLSVILLGPIVAPASKKPMGRNSAPPDRHRHP